MDMPSLYEVEEILERHASLAGSPESHARDLGQFVRAVDGDPEQKYLIAKLVAQDLVLHNEKLSSEFFAHYVSQFDLAHTNAVLTGFRLAHSTRNGCRLASDSILGFKEKYEIIECINRGGFGTIYKGHRCKLPDIPLTIKLLHGLDHSEYGDYFSRQHIGSTPNVENEARLTSKLHGDPRFVDIVDYGECWLGPFIVYNFVEGLPINQWADGKHWSTVTELVARVADALQVAHKRNVFHYDISPGNILVSPEGDPKIIDMGLAMDLNQIRTGSIGVRGTRKYMAPEFCDADTHLYFGRPDIYSLCVVMYELLGGHVEDSGFNFRTLDDVTFPADPPPTELGRILQEATHRDPSSRSISSGSELNERLTAIVDANNGQRAVSNPYSQLNGKRLLLVEDDKSWAHYAKIELRKIGVFSEVIGNFEDAIALFEKFEANPADFPFDFVSIDLHIPRGETQMGGDIDEFVGVELANKIRELRFTIPIMGMTQFSDHCESITKTNVFSQMILKPRSTAPYLLFDTMKALTSPP